MLLTPIFFIPAGDDWEEQHEKLAGFEFYGNENGGHYTEPVNGGLVPGDSGFKASGVGYRSREVS